MMIIADTNVLLRLVTGDDEAQGAAALNVLESASLVAISVHSLCELSWVLGGKFAMAREDIAAAIRGLVDAETSSSIVRLWRRVWPFPARAAISRMV